MGIHDVAETIDIGARKVVFELAQAQTRVQSEKFKLLLDYFKSSIERTFGILIEKIDISSYVWYDKTKRRVDGDIRIYQTRHSFTLSFSRVGKSSLLNEFIEEITRVSAEYEGEFRGYQKSLTPGYSDYITIHFPHPKEDSSFEEES